MMVPFQIKLSIEQQANGNAPIKIKKPEETTKKFLIDHGIDYTKSGGWEFWQVPAKVFFDSRHFLDKPLPDPCIIIIKSNLP